MRRCPELDAPLAVGRLRELEESLDDSARRAADPHGIRPGAAVSMRFAMFAASPTSPPPISASSSRRPCAAALRSLMRALPV